MEIKPEKNAFFGKFLLQAHYYPAFDIEEGWSE